MAKRGYEDIIIPRPSNVEVEYWLDTWNSLENYVLQEQSLNKLFHECCPNNIEITDILIKASTLNDFYSTNIYKVFPVAKHILELNIDERLKNHDPKLVSDIADVEIEAKDGQKKKRTFYSFASKYCSHHKGMQDEYPIYDYYVERVLLYFRKKDGFCEFMPDDLKDYPAFKGILEAFASYYKLSYGLKDLDRYLWQLGKKHFPKKIYQHGDSIPTA